MKYTGKATMRNNALCGGIRRLLVSLAIMVAVVLAIMTGAWAAPFAYVTNSDSNDVSVIDTATNSVAATIPLSGSPSGFAISGVAIMKGT